MSYSNRSLSNSSNDEENVSLLESYPMVQGFWDVETYETEDLNDYNVSVNREGIPILINAIQPFTQMHPVKKAIFVLTIDDVLRMGSKIHHSDLMHGYPVKCAGEVYFHLSKGNIIGLSNRSGHYIPAKQCLDDVVDIIRQNGYTGNIRLIDENKTQRTQKSILKPFSFKR